MLRTLCPLIALICAATAHAQPVSIVSEQVCDGCRITLQRVASLSDVGTPGAFDDFVHISTDARGWFYVVSPLAPVEVLVYDERGRYRTKFGRAGEGPGEYRIILPPYRDRNGYLHVVDAAQLRRTTLDTLYRVVATSRLPLRPTSDFVFLDSNRLVLSADVRTPQLAGLALHMVQDAALLHSFDLAEVSRENPRALRRRLASSRSDGVWAAHATRYRIDHWSAGGELTASLERQAQWFRPWTVPEGSIITHRPLPRVDRVWEDEHNRLWVIVSRADPDYRPPLRDDAGHGRPLTGADHERIWATTIEVIDLRTLRVIAVLHTPRWLNSVRNGGLLSSYREGPGGEAMFDIWRPILETGR
ncbi:MAG TPA: 6-bladed beta-propeller [Longimicrobiales bacterium]|nr:6-bladed beta-propeller [Longimicrobiales bacterium]